MLEFKEWEKYDDVILEKSGYVARITLNHPQSMNTDVWDLPKAMDFVAQADDIKVLVIKGAGRALATGAPLNKVGFVYGWKEPKKGEKAPRTPLRHRLKFDRAKFYGEAEQMLNYPKIVIIQAHGYLLGAAMDHFLFADFLVGAEDCKFGEIEVRLGIPAMTINPLLVLRCGYTNAMDLCLTGRMVNGIEAAKMGLINRAVPVDQLEDEVNRYAEGMSKFPFDGIALGRVAKQMLFDTMGVTQGLTNHFLMHTMNTSCHFEADEFNFFRARRDMGVREAIHARNKFYEQLDK